MVFLLTLTLLHFSTIAGNTVAPGDEAPLCEQFRAHGAVPKPTYPDNMRVLMDSWNYLGLLPPRNGAVWDQVDNDENNPPGIVTYWIQQSNSPCGQTVQVCGFGAGPQNNWLVTQLINRTVNGTRLSQVSVMIELEQRGCDIPLNCQRTFNTHIYETSAENADAARNINNYRQVQRVSPDVTDGSKVNETIMVNFNTNHSSFYFTIQDETSCIVVTRLIVFYQICPKQTVYLIFHPESIAPALGQSIAVTANCVTNAESVSGLAPQGLVCTTGGIWSRVPPGAACRCSDGHFPANETCRPCPVGTYLSPSNNSCSMCPANSVSEEEGLIQCTCIEGYYRAAQGEEDLLCDLPPSPPRNLSIVERTETSITVVWDPPVQQAHSIRTKCNLTYGVYTSVNGGPRVKIHHVDETKTVILNLLPGQSYTMYISSENCITDQLPENQSTTITASIEASTLETKAVSPVAAITVPSLLIVTLVVIVIISTSVILTIATRKKVTPTTMKEQVYHSEVGPPSVPVSKTNKDTFYEDMSTLDEHQKGGNVQYIMPKTSLLISGCDKVTGTLTESDPNLALGQNPAYGINTAAMAPDIDTEKNKAYGYLESHASFTVADKI